MRRMMPYGYEIRDGSYVISEPMAENVRSIYQLYLNGQSYSGISKMLVQSRDGIQWNKHRVKRILEDERYVGDDRWPAVIQREQYEKVQDTIASKTANYQKRSKPQDVIWKKLICGICGGQVHRTGARVEGGKTQLRCKECGMTLAYKSDELINEIKIQIERLCQPNGGEYEPSDEVIRIENQINRGLECPDDPECVLNQIINGAAARFRCCPEASNGRQKEPVDWMIAGRWIQSIALTENKDIYVNLKRK